jgi:F-type H+-transporting ATPase subunit delta
MANYRIATRYAEALLTAAEEQKLLDRIAADMKGLEETMQKSREFSLFLKNPIVTREKKQRILSELFEKTLHGMTVGFLVLLAEKGREEFLQDICTQFFALHDTRLGIVNVKIKAATELSGDQQKAIQRHFEDLTQKKVRLQMTVEKELRGGFLARVGDTVFDGSVKRQLEMLRERFAEGVGVN